MHTLKPSSPGFSGSKSYRAVQAGFWLAAGGTMGVLAGDFIGEGKGEAKHNTNTLFLNGIRICDEYFKKINSQNVVISEINIT